MTTGDDAAPPQARESARRPGFLELFFDLVFVLALIALAQHLLDRLDLIGAGQTLVMFLVFSLIWSLSAWAPDTLDQNRPATQAQIILVMFGSLLMAVGVTGAFAGRGLFFAVTYLSIHFTAGLSTTITVPDPALRVRTVRVLIWVALSGIAWIIGALAAGGARLAWWGAAVAVEYSAAAVGWLVPGLGRSRSPEWRLAGERVSERYRQFVIIALGVSIFTTASAFAEVDRTAVRVKAFGIVFATTALLWLMYIRRAGALLTRAIAVARNPAALTQFAALTHLIMVAGIITTAVASRLVIGRPHGGTPPASIAVILGGPALFLLGRAVLDYTVFSRVSWSRVGGLMLLAVLLAFVHLVSPLALAFATMLVLVVIVAADLVLTRLRPATPRPPELT